MKIIRFNLLLLMSCLSCVAVSDVHNVPSKSIKSVNCASWLNVKVSKLNSSKVIDLCQETKGKTVLIVNTASHCGYTYQFTNLEVLHNKYKDEGLVIIGVPSNDFNQEAKSETQTANMCYKNHGVTFLMTSKQHVKGDDAHPIFKHVSMKTSAPSWNFTKYLIDKEGHVVERFSSRVKPDGIEVMTAVEKIL